MREKMIVRMKKSPLENLIACLILSACMIAGVEFFLRAIA